MKKIFLFVSLLAFITSCQNDELEIKSGTNTNVTSRSANDLIYSAQNGVLSWKCGVLSGQVGSQGSSVAIEMEMNYPKTFYALSYYDSPSHLTVKNPIVEDAAGLDVHTIECGEGYAVLYSSVSGEDLVNVWLEGQDFDDPFKIPCYVFDINSYSLMLNESKTTLIVSPSLQSRSMKKISSIEIMTYDKCVVFTQTYDGTANAGVNVSSFAKGKYVVKVKDELGTVSYQRLIIE